jgi:hypothetical protein
MRKPGEPIYQRRHMLALMSAIMAPIGLPRLYEITAGPLSLTARMAAGLLIAVAAGMLLYWRYSGSARNEP